MSEKINVPFRKNRTSHWLIAGYVQEDKKRKCQDISGFIRIVLVLEIGWENHSTRRDAVYTRFWTGANQHAEKESYENKMGYFIKNKSLRFSMLPFVTLMMRRCVWIADRRRTHRRPTFYHWGLAATSYETKKHIDNSVLCMNLQWSRACRWLYWRIIYTNINSGLLQLLSLSGFRHTCKHTDSNSDFSYWH
jgi:hypothetical protein